MSDKLVALDSEDTSVSVAEARHMVRKNMLLTALDNLFEIGVNKENRVADRTTALKEIVHFASEAQGGGSKQVGKLSPQAARLIAKLGLQKTGEGNVTEGQIGVQGKSGVGEAGEGADAEGERAGREVFSDETEG